MSLSGNSEHVVIGVDVVEYVVNGSYDSGVLRTKLIGECRIDFTNISSNDNSTIVVPSFMFKDFLFS